MEKKKKVGKIIGRVLLILLGVIVLFVAGVFVVHRVKTGKEIALLKEKGYYNPVSVGDYSLNVARFGNENGKHTFVGLAGLCMGDYAVTARQMTAPLEEDNLFVFVDRAGYGFSDDTNNEMTLEYIVEDYRKALKNAGLEAPYILMAHSIGGAYANFWVSNYPEEIEAVVFVDGSQLSASAFEEEPEKAVGFGDRALALLAKLGFSRFLLRTYSYLYPDNFSDEEQYLGDALSLMTLDSIAPISEAGIIARNGQDAWSGIITNDVPKLYICASWGFQTVEEMIENDKFINREIEKNNLDGSPRPVVYEGNEKFFDTYLALLEDGRRDVIYPYAEKMGNCKVVLLPGDHMIFEQKPAECARVIMDFLEEIDR